MTTDAARFTLLRSSPGYELTKIDLTTGSRFLLNPCEDAYHFVYLLSGLCHEEQTGRFLVAGGNLSSASLKTPVLYKAVGSVSLLYVTSELIFARLSLDPSEFGLTLAVVSANSPCPLKA